jgi:hypothetical protein
MLLTAADMVGLAVVIVVAQIIATVGSEVLIERFLIPDPEEMLDADELAREMAPAEEELTAKTAPDGAAAVASHRLDAPEYPLGADGDPTPDSDLDLDLETRADGLPTSGQPGAVETATDDDDL